MPAIAYQPRRAHESPLYGAVLDHHERFATVYDDLYATRYGDWRPEVADTFRRFLDCGILANGFLRVRCGQCGHEVRVPWSCKKVGLCPSCAQRRSLEFGEFVSTELLGEVAYLHVVFVIPKLLRPIFLRERKLLTDLGRCAWQTVRRGLATALGLPDARPGAVSSLALAGDTSNPHPHVHAAVSAGAWDGSAPDAPFRPWPAQLDAERLTQLFRRLVLKMLVRRQRLTEATAQKLLGWEHSGFSVWIGAPIKPEEVESRRRLARYLVKAPLSLERLRYDPATCRIAYGSSKRGQERTMGALDLLAELSAMIPDRGQHLVSHWGRCSNRARGERRKALAATSPAGTSADARPPSDPETDPAFHQKRKTFRMAWAALLKKIWGVQVLACPKCASHMEIVSAITDPVVVARILRHVGLFDQPRPPNSHERCPTPPSTVEGQTLLVFPRRLPEAPQRFPENDVDPRLGDDWAVDPPFEED